jgi:small subunit ribosomal protein S18
MPQPQKQQQRLPQQQKPKPFNLNFFSNRIMASRDDIKFLSNPNIGGNRKKYCRFRKFGIKYIDYKDNEFLLQFVNEQGKLLPRRITGNSLKYQRKMATAVKRARHLAFLPYLTDLLK